MITFVVLGHAQPAGSKTARPIRRKDGSYVTTAKGNIVVPVVDANKKSAGWKKIVAKAASQAYSGPPLDEPLRVRMTFVRARPKCHYRTGKNAHLLKDDAPSQPIFTPDVLKLARGAEDAMTGIIYCDDARTVSLEVDKCFGEPECVIVIIERESEWTRTRVPEEILRPMRIRLDYAGTGMSEVRVDRLRALHSEPEADSQGSSSDPQEVEHGGEDQARSVGAFASGITPGDGASHFMAQPENDPH